MDSKALFKERLTAHIKEVVRYSQYILNGHIAIAILFLIGAGAVFYQQLLTQLPANFPTDWVISIAFALVALYNPIQNLLKEADLIYLFPAEKRLTPYFNYTLWYSFLTQLYVFALVAAALAPLYQASSLNQSYNVLVFLLLFFKVWHFLLNWWMLRVRDKTINRLEKMVRYLLQWVIFISFINGYTIAAGLVTVALFGYVFYFYRYSHRYALAWDQLIEKDQQKMQSFYRFASMFTDVPHFKAKIKKRRLLVRWFTSRLPFKQSYTYHFLYRMTFLRSADYFGLYVRLTVIASVFMIYFNHALLIFSLLVLILFVTGIQLIPLWYHHRTNVWQELYPVPTAERQLAVQRLIEQLLGIQLLIMALVIWLSTDHWLMISAFVIGIIFTFGFSRLYVASKLDEKA